MAVSIGAQLGWIMDRVTLTPDLRWARDGGDWPNREFSRFVRADGIRWHVQELGSGPDLLLLHGTGASTHSWRALAPQLAESYSVLALDLPGHGFTRAPALARYSLSAMADVVAGLARTLGRRPEVIVGHSAGAAIACRACLDGSLSPRRVVSLNGALLPLQGWSQPFWTPLARAFTLNPLLPGFLALSGRDPDLVERMLKGTGSRIDEAGKRLYGRLLRSPEHIGSTLRMMAHWDLWTLERDLPGLETPLALLVGDRDRFIPPSEAKRVRRLVPHAEIATLGGLGHLAHEEQPDRIAAMLQPSLLFSEEESQRGFTAATGLQEASTG